MYHLAPVGSGARDPLPDGDCTMHRYARLTEAVLDDVGAPTAYVLGRSHGGFVALHIAIEHRDRLDGLILYDTAPVFGAELTETATSKTAAFVQRWPVRPEAVEAAHGSCRGQSGRPAAATVPGPARRAGPRCRNSRGTGLRAKW
ncbi:alpha/beta hydrolase [Streptomyces sp. NPDC051987]|uniref:alpha/beta fold hydrolase n=1 Tax=Streptomyces sp. NPDC051987 TaxID=3155808 RepID=UPI003440E45C